MFVVFSVTLLCLASVSQSAPLACEVLNQPLNQLDSHHLEGGWALVATGFTFPFEIEDLKLRGSRTVYISNSSETSAYSYTRAYRLDDQCAYLSHNFTIGNNTITELDGSFNLTWSFFNTSCPDCFVVHSLFRNDKDEMQELSLFSRRRQLEQKEMDEFRALVECLKMRPLVVMDPTEELCPRPTTSDPAAQTEEKTEGQKD